MAEKKTVASKSAVATATKPQQHQTDTKQAAETPNMAQNSAPPAVLEEEINLDAKVTVKNLAGWDVTFARLQDGHGDIVIVANGQQRMSRNEVIAQVNNNNRLFTGYDSSGSHATIFIDDAATRRWVGFEEKGKPQMVFTEKLVKDLFAMNQSEYETALPHYIRTRAEKYALIETIKKLKLNDYAKVVFATEYTGYKIR